ncbi:MAG: hypothetical protein L6265_09780, partial [Thermoplasmatales archaeon]|nr:hypothetical protein [Thermoplasmatales archaeon]
MHLMLTYLFIVTDSVDEDVAKTLESLGVKYSLVCGDMKGYKLTKHFNSVEEIQDWTISVVRQRLGDDVSYITMANPMDAYRLKIEETYSPPWSPITDEIEHSPSTSYPGRPEMGEGPIHYFNVPYKYANIIIDVTMDISQEAWGDDSGARMYAFLGIDGNKDGVLEEGSEDDHIKFFGGSPGYSIIGIEDEFTGGIGTSVDGTPKSSLAHFRTE